jgi:hypothetical protein
MYMRKLFKISFLVFTEDIFLKKNVLLNRFLILT